jgi:hypothetical protein
VVWLLFAGFYGLGHGQERPDPPTGEAGPAPRLHVAVRQGRLSVDLLEAEVGEVLARIGQEAGVVITSSPTSGVQVSAQFTDMALEQGLRRLLRLASLSYAIRYTQGPTGAVVMHEMRVFRAASDGIPSQPRIIEHDAEERAGAPVSPEGDIGWRVKPKKSL